MIQQVRTLEFVNKKHTAITKDVFDCQIYQRYLISMGIDKDEIITAIATNWNLRFVKKHKYTMFFDNICFEGANKKLTNC